MKFNQNEIARKLSKSSALKTAGAVALVALALAGTMVVPNATPNVLKALYKLYRYKRRRNARAFAEQQSTRVLYYLKRTGYVRFHKTGKEMMVSLTSLGRKRLQKLAFEHLIIPRPKKWDGKWWGVAADIPTKEYKIAADCLRYKLIEVGFKPLQRTLWIHPFDPRHEVEEIARHYGVERFVTVLEVSRLDIQDEKVLRKHFHKKGVL